MSTTIIRKQDGSIDLRKTPKAALLAALEAEQAKANAPEVVAPRYKVGGKGGVVVQPGKGRMCSSFYLNQQHNVDRDLMARAKFIVNNINHMAVQEESQREAALAFYQGILNGDLSVLTPEVSALEDRGNSGKA